MSDRDVNPGEASVSDTVEFNLQAHLETMRRENREDAQRVIDTFTRHEEADRRQFAKIERRFDEGSSQMARLNAGQDRLRRGHATLIWWARAITLAAIGALLKYLVTKGGV